MRRRKLRRAPALAALALTALVFAPPAGTAEPTGTRAVVTGVYPLPGATVVAPATKTSAPSHALCSKDVPRATKDRPDVLDGRLIHVVYLVAADAPDERLDELGVLDCSVIAQNEWFEQASGGLRWRFDTVKVKARNAKTGALATRAVTDVTFVRSASTMAELGNSNAVIAQLRNLDLSDPNKRYLTYVAGGAPGGPCGDAIFPVVSGEAQPDGQFAQVYLFSDAPCRAHEFGSPGDGSFAEMIAQQEIIHNDGVVSAGAPHGCPAGVPPGMGHVCTGPLVLTEGNANLDPERVDVMYPFVSVPLSEKVLDPGGDDYFNTVVPTLRNVANSPYLEQAR